jgi:CBS domain-containing protein
VRVKDVMYRDLTSITPETDLREAVQVMADHRTSGLPVVDDNFLVVGFLSERDIIETAYPYPEIRSDDLMLTARLSDLVRKLGLIKGRRAEACMTQPAVTAGEEDDVEEIITEMLMRGLKIMPVVRDRRLVGIIRRADLAATIVSEGDRD